MTDLKTLAQAIFSGACISVLEQSGKTKEQILQSSIEMAEIFESEWKKRYYQEPVRPVSVPTNFLKNGL